MKDAVEKGAQLVTGGKRHELGGNYFLPTVLADVTDKMEIFHSEIFGPVASIIRYIHNILLKNMIIKYSLKAILGIKCRDFILWNSDRPYTSIQIGIQIGLGSHTVRVNREQRFSVFSLIDSVVKNDRII